MMIVGIFFLLFVLVTSDLYSSLDGLVFYNSGTVNASDKYFWWYQDGYYAEQQNVTGAPYSWSTNGGFNYLYQANSSTTYESCTAYGPTQQNTDLPGCDTNSVPLKSGSTATDCSQLCCNTQSCVAWVFTTAPGDFNECKKGDLCCYLKGCVPTSNPSNGISSGTVTQPPNPGIPPVTGVRSSVPIGGFTAGSFELRADGTFTEWTIMNQSPGGGAKFATQNDALLGMRINGVARSIRTNPPTGIDGVKSIEYSGAYPVSRLKISDPVFDVPFSLYGYSIFNVSNMQWTATPAAIFSVNVENPTSQPLTADFFFNLPFGQEENMNRRMTQATMTTPDSGSCLTACAKDDTCQSWTWDGSDNSCSFEKNIPLNTFTEGRYSGVKGVWTYDGFQPFITLSRPGIGPTAGDLTLSPSVKGATSWNFSFGASNDPTALWNSFATTGGLGNSQFPSGLMTAHGAAAVSTTIPAGGHATLSLMFAWYFPYRDNDGISFGNYYSTFYNNSQEIVSQLTLKLQGIVDDIAQVHNVFFNSSLPDYLKDTLVNSVSHYRSAMWLRDGRWRQWEAYDCVNINSVHNDYQRHFPYILFFPQATISTIEAWASYQLSDGRIQEELAEGCGGATPQIDTPGGRVMGDVTSIFVLEILELYKWTGDEKWLQTFWYNVKAAVYWQINYSTTYGLPAHIQCTYDILGLENYPLASFNAFTYLASLKAGIEFGNIMGDTQFVSDVTNALEKGQDTLQNYLWNENRGCFQSYWTDVEAESGSNSVMVDTLYGQVVAFTLGLGPVISNTTQLLSHLNAELEYNDSPYGLLVMTGRQPPATDPAQDNSIWMGGSPDWTTLALHLGTDAATALPVAEKSLDNWRLRLNDQWNIHGLAGGIGYGADGQPWCTSHYGFHMVLWHIPFALSGQYADLSKGIFTFHPKLTAPYTLPALLPNLLASITEANGQYTFTVVKGYLNLNTLAINGVNYTSLPVVLSGGQSVSWASM